MEQRPVSERVFTRLGDKNLILLAGCRGGVGWDFAWNAARNGAIAGTSLRRFCANYSILIIAVMSPFCTMSL